MSARSDVVAPTKIDRMVMVDLPAWGVDAATVNAALAVADLVF